MKTHSGSLSSHSFFWLLFSVSRGELLWWFCLICHLFIWGSHDEDYRGWTNPSRETDYYWDCLYVIACILFHEVWFAQHWTSTLWAVQDLMQGKYLKFISKEYNKANAEYSVWCQSWNKTLILNLFNCPQNHHKSRLWTLLCHSDFSKQWWHLQIQSMMLFYIFC